MMVVSWRPWPSVLDLSGSAGPEGSEAVGGREKTKTENAGGPGARLFCLYSSTPVAQSRVLAARHRAAAAGAGGVARAPVVPTGLIKHPNSHRQAQADESETEH